MVKHCNPGKHTFSWPSPKCVFCSHEADVNSPGFKLWFDTIAENDDNAEDVMEVYLTPPPLPVAQERKIKRQTWSVNSRIIPPKLKTKLRNPIENPSKTCFKIAKDLLRCGYSSDEVLDFIRDNPTFESGFPPDYSEEKLIAAIKAAVKSISTEK